VQTVDKRAAFSMDETTTCQVKQVNNALVQLQVALEPKTKRNSELHAC
jgi:hypothetical protein